MKNPIILLTLATLLMSCGTEQVTDDTVMQFRAQRDSLKHVREELNSHIAETESWLAKNDPELQRNLPVITTYQLKPQEFAHYTEAHGSVKADNNALLYSSAGGEVRRVLVRAGQKVTKGEMIVDIDMDAMRSNVQQARTNVKLASDVFERQQQLWEQKIGSELQFLEAKSRKEAGEAQLASLQEQLQSAQIIAPFNGVVDEIFPNVGDMTSPMQPVARVVSLGKASIETELSEDMLNKVALNDPVEVYLPESNEVIVATIDQIGQYINPNNRTFKVTLRITDGTKLRPNQLAKVRIRDMEQKEALVLPSRMVMENSEGKSYVFSVAEVSGEMRAKKIFVDVLSSQDGELLIRTNKEGLQGGEQLIDQGARMVVDKQEVKIM